MRQLNLSGTIRFGGLSLELSGKTLHTEGQVHQCADLMSSVLRHAGYKGKFRLSGETRRIKGRQTLQGLSMVEAGHHYAIVAFQPNGNDSRLRYRISPLGESRLSDPLQFFTDLKDVIGTAYTGESETKPVYNANQADEVEDLDEEETISEAETFVKPTKEPEVQYTKDLKWIEDVLLHLSVMADEYEGRIPKDVVYDFIVGRTHFNGPERIGFILQFFYRRGNLKKIHEGEEVFFEVSLDEKSDGKAKLTYELPSYAPGFGVRAFLEIFCLEMYLTAQEKKQKTGNERLSREDFQDLVREQYPELTNHQIGAVSRYLTSRSIIERTPDYTQVCLGLKGLRLYEAAKANEKKVAQGPSSVDSDVEPPTHTVASGYIAQSLVRQADAPSVRVTPLAKVPDEKLHELTARAWRKAEEYKALLAEARDRLLRTEAELEGKTKGYKKMRRAAKAWKKKAEELEARPSGIDPEDFEDRVQKEVKRRLQAELSKLVDNL